MENEKKCKLIAALMQRGGRMYTTVLPETVQGRYRFEGDGQEQSVLPVSIYGRNGKWFVECGKGAAIHQEGEPKEGTEALLPTDGSHGLNISFSEHQSLFVLHVEKVESTSLAFCSYEIMKGVDEIRIGRDKKNTIYYQCPYVSDQHAVLKRENDEWYISDENSTNGTYVNGHSLNRKKKLSVGDLAYIMGLYLIFGGNFLTINKTQDIDEYPTCVIDHSCLPIIVPENPSSYLSLPAKGENRYFLQYPRRKYHIEADQIEIQQPPMSLGRDGASLLMRLSNPLMMGARSMMSGNVTMAMSSMLLPFMTQGLGEKERKDYSEKRLEWYAQYCLKKAEEIKTEKEREEAELEKIHPSLDALLKLEDKTRLWEYRLSDPDFLQIRIGTRVRMPMIAKLLWPKDEFEMPDSQDQAKEHLEELKKYSFDLTDVPALVSLKESFIIGIVSQEYGGGSRRVAVNLMVRLALTHGYDDVKIVILAAPEDTADISKYLRLFRYLPHCWDNYRETRFFAETQEDVLSISNYLKNELEDSEKQDHSFKRTAYVIFAFSRPLLDSFGLVKTVMESNRYQGISIITAFEGPLKESQMLIRMEGEKKGKLVDLHSAEEKDIDFRAETYDFDRLTGCLKTLFHTKLQMDGKSFTLPKTFTFMEMLNIGRLEDLNLADLWEQHNPKTSLAAPIGIGTHGELVYLDLHQKSHGPHGLIAGTTGSGKSEFIITYILSMAINFRPDEVAFVLIDYKGGGLVDAFVDSKPDPIKGEAYHLPHVLGTITNLDGSSIQRCLSSLQAELTRRQQMFRDAMEVSNEGKMEIYEYQKLYRARKVSEPIPHLFLIADEFAELKQKEPEFMDTLVSIARIGRSLGVHLILATQKPSGVVNDQIWSNTRFRVCLKVQDRSDSQEMLKRPEAAAIKETGRFYLQVGQNEIFSLGQSAYCGAEYHPSDRVEKQVDETVVFLDHTGQVRLEKKPEKKKKIKGEEAKSQLVSTVAHLTDFIKENPEFKKVKSIWLPSLAEQGTIPFDAVCREYQKEEDNAEKHWELTAVLGRIDDPSNIRQFLMTIDLAESRHIMICGAAGSGKSTLLFTLLYALSKDYSPAELHYYIFDCSNGLLKAFEQLPHCGVYTHNGDEADFQRILSFIQEEIGTRRKLFEAEGSNTFREFRETDTFKKNPMSMILLVIDSYTKESVGYETHTSFYQFLREASNFGIQVILTASSLSEIFTKMREEMSVHLALHAATKYDYHDILGEKTAFVPTDKPGHGMCLIKEQKDKRVLEWKAAVVAGEINEDDRKTEQILRIEKLREKYSGFEKAPFWKQINEDQTYEEFCDQFELGRFPLGFYKGNATPRKKPGDPIVIPLRQMTTLGVYFGSQQAIPSVVSNLLFTFRREKMQVTILRRKENSLFDSEQLRDTVSLFVKEQEAMFGSASPDELAMETMPAVTSGIGDWLVQKFQERLSKWQRHKEKNGIVHPTIQNFVSFFKHDIPPWLIMIESASDLFGILDEVRKAFEQAFEESPETRAKAQETVALDDRIKEAATRIEQLKSAGSADAAAIREAEEDRKQAEEARRAIQADIQERQKERALGNLGKYASEFLLSRIESGLTKQMNMYFVLMSDRTEEAMAVDFIHRLCHDQFLLFFGESYSGQSLDDAFPSGIQAAKDAKPGSCVMKYKKSYYPVFMPCAAEEETVYDDPDDAPII